jgi:hypothetical protein
LAHLEIKLREEPSDKITLILEIKSDEGILFMRARTSHRSFVLIFGLASLNFACTKNQGTTSLTIALPQTPSVAAPAPARKTDVSASSSGNSWGLADPVSASQFKCFAVFLGGPEAELSNSSCTLSNGSTIKFGKFQGFVAAGGSVSFDSIPSGANRQLFLMGLALQDGASCETVGAGAEVTQSQYSQPFMLGQAAVNLKAGDNDASINGTFAADTPKVSDCNFFKGNGANAPVYIGKGEDGSLTIPNQASGTASFDLSTMARGDGTFYTTARRVMKIRPGASAGIFDVLVNDPSLNASNFKTGDEISVYVAASNDTVAGCGSNIYTGFRTIGFVTSFTAGSPATISATLSDGRFGNSIPVANFAADAAGTAPFCYVTVQRVPHISDLVLGMNAKLTMSGAGALAGLPSAAPAAGFMMLRVSGSLKATDIGAGFDMAGKGFKGGLGDSMGGFPGEGAMGVMPASSPLFFGSGGGGYNSVTGVGAAGGGGGGLGMSGAVGGPPPAPASTPNGGWNFGDQYGCNSYDATSKCLFGKIFMGGGGGGGLGGGGTQDGRSGGGVIMIFANELNVVPGASLTVDTGGTTGQVSTGGAAGGGGSVHIRLNKLSVGNSALMTINAKGGDQPDSQGKAGAGGGGRIHLDINETCDVADATHGAVGVVAANVLGGTAGFSAYTRFPDSTTNGTTYKTGPAVGQGSCNLTGFSN